MIATNDWRSYHSILPSCKHISIKAKTYTVEGYNSLFRHYLARMRRKNKCYSKSVKMLRYSMMLLMVKCNGELAIFD